MKPIILLNAPPNAGKDTIADEICKRLDLPKVEFKGKLFELALSISGLSKGQWDSVYTRELKEVKTDLLFGLSPREFLIDISERMIKPLCGEDYFGVQAVKLSGGGAVFSDSGFDKEAEALVDAYGAKNVYCVQFDRVGCSFEGDSRDYLKTQKIKNYLKTTNNCKIENIVDTIISWLGEKNAI